jgi:hypothetical protein
MAWRAPSPPPLLAFHCTLADKVTEHWQAMPQSERESHQREASYQREAEGGVSSLTLLHREEI